MCNYEFIMALITPNIDEHETEFFLNLLTGN